MLLASRNFIAPNKAAKATAAVPATSVVGDKGVAVLLCDVHDKDFNCHGHGHKAEERMRIVVMRVMLMVLMMAMIVIMVLHHCALS